MLIKKKKLVACYKGCCNHFQLLVAVRGVIGSSYVQQFMIVSKWCNTLPDKNPRSLFWVLNPVYWNAISKLFASQQ